MIVTRRMELYAPMEFVWILNVIVMMDLEVAIAKFQVCIKQFLPTLPLTLS
jgi:hypothetical protein